MPVIQIQSDVHADQVDEREIILVTSEEKFSFFRLVGELSPKRGNASATHFLPPVYI